jgi:hypothetical protein
MIVGEQYSNGTLLLLFRAQTRFQSVDLPGPAETSLETDRGSDILLLVEMPLLGGKLKGLIPRRFGASQRNGIVPH